MGRVSIVLVCTTSSEEQDTWLSTYDCSLMVWRIDVFTNLPLTYHYAKRERGRDGKRFSHDKLS